MSNTNSIFDAQLGSISHLLRVANTCKIDLSDTVTQLTPLLSVIDNVVFTTINGIFVPVFQYAEETMQIFTPATYPTETDLWRIETILSKAIETKSATKTPTFGDTQFQDALTRLQQYSTALSRDLPEVLHLVSVIPGADTGTFDPIGFRSGAQRAQLKGRISESGRIAIAALLDFENALLSMARPTTESTTDKD